MQESGEMYLETILVLSSENPIVRSIDVAEELGYSKPSVSRAVGILKKDGYVIVNEFGGLELTDAGKEIAFSIFDRHKVLTKFFESIGVSEEISSKDACRIEHVISNETFRAIKKQMGIKK